MTETIEQAGTRERIIDTAGALFAAQGFRGTTIRDICGQAGVNVAAVNYYFRDKESLYSEVLQHAHRSCSDKYPMDMGVPEGAGPAEQLEGFVRSFLHRLLDEGRPSWHGKLMAMEMADPTQALDQLVDESIVPMYRTLEGIVRELLGPGAANEDVERCTGSVIGQVLHYKHAKPVIVRMGLWRIAGVEDVASLARFIVEFSLGGIARLRERQLAHE